MLRRSAGAAFTSTPSFVILGQHAGEHVTIHICSAKKGPPLVGRAFDRVPSTGPPARPPRRPPHIVSIREQMSHGISNLRIGHNNQASGMRQNYPEGRRIGHPDRYTVGNGRDCFRRHELQSQSGAAEAEVTRCGPSAPPPTPAVSAWSPPAGRSGLETAARAHHSR